MAYWDLSNVLKIFYERNGLIFLKIVLKIWSITGGDPIVVCPKDACIFAQHLEGETVRTSPLGFLFIRQHMVSAVCGHEKLVVTVVEVEVAALSIGTKSPSQVT